MTKEFLEWFGDTFKEYLFSPEDFEELKIYTWLAWRDSRREMNK